MEDNDLSRRIEIMAEMLHEQRETNTRLGEMNNRIKKKGRPTDKNKPGNWQVAALGHLISRSV